MTPKTLALTIALAVLALFSTTIHSSSPSFQSKVIEVEMQNYKFVTDEITARPGDTIRFVNVTNVPHNVEFKKVPDSMKFSDKSFSTISAGDTLTVNPPPRVGPMVIGKKGVYQMIVNDWPEGVYSYICSPHVSLGMKGKITVEK